MKSVHSSPATGDHRVSLMTGHQKRNSKRFVGLRTVLHLTSSQIVVSCFQNPRSTISLLWRWPVFWTTNSVVKIDDLTFGKVSVIIYVGLYLYEINTWPMAAKSPLPPLTVDQKWTDGGWLSTSPNYEASPPKLEDLQIPSFFFKRFFL